MLKAVPLEVWTGPQSSRILRLPESAREFGRVVRFSALDNGRLYPPGVYLLDAESPQGHRTAGGFKSMKNPNEPIGKGTCDLLACSSVSQPNGV